MGGQSRLTKRIERLEGLVQALGAQVQATAESAGSALAVEALCEIAGTEGVGRKMAAIAKRHQEEAEAEAARRIKAEVDAGGLVPAEVVGRLAVVVAQRTEGEASYRVDIVVTPTSPANERAKLTGCRVGDVLLWPGLAKTEIREIYGPAQKAAPEPDVEVKQEADEAEAAQAAQEGEG